MTTFYIVTRPRSGSHMLASALDSHPDIQCKGEKGYERYSWLGAEPADVSGYITHLKAFNISSENIKLTDVDKVIVLMRDLTKRKRYEGGSSFHAFHPQTVKAVPGEVEDHSPADLYKFTENCDRLVLNYEDLTRNRDMREIPEPIARKICSFLGVEHHPMSPKTYKPIVSAL